MNRQLAALTDAAARFQDGAEWVTWDAPGIRCDGCSQWTIDALVVPVPRQHAHRVCPACTRDPAILRRLWDRRIARLAPAPTAGEGP